MSHAQWMEEQQHSESARFDRFDGFDRGDLGRDHSADDAAMAEAEYEQANAMNTLYFVKFENHDKVRQYTYSAVFLVTVPSGMEEHEKQQAEIAGRLHLADPGPWRLIEATRVCSTPDTLEHAFEPC